MIVFFLCSALALLVFGWGPGHHLEFSERVMRRRKELLPRAVSELLAAERDAYEYGNLAADIINFKAWGGAYTHCHRWAIIDDMRALATTPRDEAFILGYLSHLAADTIAHNHFVPYHLARYARTTKGLGHLYWEMSADRFVPEDRWKVITRLKSQKALTELDELVNRTVPRKALSMGTNKFLFNHVLLVSERERWRRGMQNIHPVGEVKLKKGFLGLFQEAAVDRIRLALHPRGFREIQRVDANGKDAQAHALRLREGWIARFAGRKDDGVAREKSAEPFLAGMQSPPP